MLRPACLGLAPQVPLLSLTVAKSKKDRTIVRSFRFESRSPFWYYFDALAFNPLNANVKRDL
jgi:hypothetical protein